MAAAALWKWGGAIFGAIGTGAFTAFYAGIKIIISSIG